VANISSATSEIRNQVQETRSLTSCPFDFLSLLLITYALYLCYLPLFTTFPSLFSLKILGVIAATKTNAYFCTPKFRDCRPCKNRNTIIFRRPVSPSVPLTKIILTEGHKKKLALHGAAFAMDPESNCTGVV